MLRPPRASDAWSRGLAKAVRVEGKVISAEDLTIDGDVEGSIELGGHSLAIGQDATIKADLLAKTVVISGKVTGNVKAVEKSRSPLHGNRDRRHHGAAIRHG